MNLSRELQLDDRIKFTQNDFKVMSVNSEVTICLMGGDISPCSHSPSETHTPRLHIQFSTKGKVVKIHSNRVRSADYPLMPCFFFANF